MSKIEMSKDFRELTTDEIEGISGALKLRIRFGCPNGHPEVEIELET